MLIAGEDEAGSADAGSRASSEVAQTVRMSRAKDLSELVSHQLNDSLIRWMVDLNFGTNVQSPKILRDFDPKEDVQLTMADVATMVKDVGFAPTEEWLTDRFDVEVEDKPAAQEDEQAGGESAEGPAASDTGETAPKEEAGSEGSSEDLPDAELDALIASILGEG